MTKVNHIPLLLAVALAGCGGGSPSAGTPAAPSASPSPSPAPTPGAASFTISLPVRPGESARNAFGINPFGAHIGDHGIDGHPGWDVEYVLGGTVVAAAAGTVQSALPADGAWVIQISHQIAGRDAYRTIYGVATLSPGITAGAAVTRLQPLGTVSSYTRTIGTITVTYAFTHFQLDDFSRNVGLTNPNATSPETFLDAEARQSFQTLWRDAVYSQEPVEPFATNPRDVSFPMSRTWTLTSGGLAARLEFVRANALTSTFTYVMRDAGGTVTERGAVEIEVLARPNPTVDFIPDGGAGRRRGVYSIVDGAMDLDYGAPGASRPSSIAGASRYTTTP